MSSSRALAPPVRFLVQQAAARYDLLENEVLERDRTPRKVAARAEVARELRRRGHSYPAIGRMMGGYSHTTVMNLLRPAVARMGRPPIAKEWDREAPDLSGEWAI